LVLVAKPVQRAEPGRVIREGSTGQVVTVLPQVWAVEEMLPDTMSCVPTHAQRPRMNGAPELCGPIHAQEARMNGAPGGDVGRAHVSEARHGAPDAVTGAEAGGMEAPKVEVAFYRKYTEGMLRRYLRLSMQTGRVPSVMGREMFRGHVSSYRVHSFEDVVVFCIDMEKCMAKLERLDQQLIKRITLQEYTQGEAAAMLGLSLRSCVRRYAEALDRLTELLLVARMLEPMKDCQEARPRAGSVGGSLQRG
jgi:hypothetical protein